MVIDDIHNINSNTDNNTHNRDSVTCNNNIIIGARAVSKGFMMYTLEIGANIRLAVIQKVSCFVGCNTHH